MERAVLRSVDALHGAIYGGKYRYCNKFLALFRQQKSDLWLISGPNRIPNPDTNPNLNPNPIFYRFTIDQEYYRHSVAQKVVSFCQYFPPVFE